MENTQTLAFIKELDFVVKVGDIVKFRNGAKRKVTYVGMCDDPIYPLALNFEVKEHQENKRHSFTLSGIIEISCEENPWDIVGIIKPLVDAPIDLHNEVFGLDVTLDNRYVRLRSGKRVKIVKCELVLNQMYPIKLGLENNGTRTYTYDGYENIAIFSGSPWDIMEILDK